MFNQQNPKSKSKKSTQRKDGGPYSGTTSRISSGNKSCAKSLFEYNFDETLEIKQEVLEDPETEEVTNEKCDTKYESIVCTVDIREDILADLQSASNNANNLEIRFTKSAVRQYGRSHSCTSTQISSGHNSDAKTSIEYDIDETMEIKEEIVEGKSKTGLKKTGIRSRGEYQAYILKHHMAVQDLLSKNNGKDFTCKIEYGNDENLEIKEEIIEDHDIYSRGYIKPSYNRKSQMILFKNQAKRKTKIQKSKVESEKKHKCEKCAREYIQKRSLRVHQKYECGVIATNVLELTLD
ncbi:uncharacterized protein LOC117182760 [Belonocnema kinseyi]|uniref:uncharacterized protein LOC117182760 n=1 Tax=Belonocnema kinseyi TaxID=2817044 RepID=UPI00143D4589|nr:uncharacterized protein LOC117182760 [Belonocnema kinseyi]